MKAPTILTCIAAASAAASAAPVTENPFAEFSVQTFAELPSEFTSGPREAGIGDDSVLFTSTNGSSVFAYDAAYALNTNGDWGGGRRGFVGLNAPFGTLRFTFATPVSGVGAFVNYAPPPTSNGEAILTVRGADDQILETFNLSIDAPIVTPDAVDAGAFRGFERQRADIVAFELSNGFIVLDDLTWSRENAFTLPVPVPAALPLFLAGASALGIGRRTRKGRG